MKRQTKIKNFIYPLLLLAPALIILLVFKVLPIILAFRFSFFNWGIAGSKGFVGLRNYKIMFQDPLFWRSLLNTFYYAIVTVPLSMIFSMIIAALLNRGIKALGVFRTIYYLPVVTSLVAVSVVWKWLYDPTRGLFNQILQFLGLSPLQWLQEYRGIFELILGKELPLLLKGPSLALFSLSILGVWRSLGYNVVIFLAGLKNIPKVYYDAAKVDGANTFQTFWHVTVPLLSPTTFYVAIMTTITSFQMFAPVWTMTGPPPGGPLHSTLVIIYYLFRRGFEEYLIGYGSAIAFVFFLIILAITILQRKYLEKRVYYEV
ncbi:MAG: sugar ABC transporter permease [Candidatus Hydrothermota bacterium]|nr:MAG: sugar ABC transporter permease [Candidatus Hydrothermae bacterium]